MMCIRMHASFLQYYYGTNHSTMVMHCYIVMSTEEASPTIIRSAVLCREREREERHGNNAPARKKKTVHDMGYYHTTRTTKQTHTDTNQQTQ